MSDNAHHVWYMFADTDLIPFSRSTSLAVGQGMFALQFLEQAKQHNAQKTAHVDANELVLYLVAGGFLAKELESKSLRSHAVRVFNRQRFTQDQSKVEGDPSLWTGIPESNDRKIYYLVQVPSVRPAGGMSPLPVVLPED